jgi:oxygen-independent coproporphyrinogen-3 oxidase
MEVSYRESLRGEIAQHAWTWTPETVYLGGGTPSSLDTAALTSLLELIPGRPWIEATIEAAPGTITAEGALAWARMGINRVSLGVQSFVRQEIAAVGRKHAAETVARDLAVLHEAGLENVNIDLIAGLPGQTPSSWRESLQWIERLNPTHVSIYMLEVDEESRLGREIQFGGARYGARDVPCEELIADLYETAVEHLAGMGINRYEISNFARPGSESRHNLKYWKLEPYVGFGADAHSFDGTRRWRNPESVDEYLKCLCPEFMDAQPDEKFFVGLRLSEGIHLEVEEWQRFRGPIGRFLAAGLLASDGDTLRLTGRGILLSNEIFQEFLTT